MNALQNLNEENMDRVQSEMIEGLISTHFDRAFQFLNSLLVTCSCEAQL